MDTGTKRRTHAAAMFLLRSFLLTMSGSLFILSHKTGLCSNKHVDIAETCGKNSDSHSHFQFHLVMRDAFLWQPNRSRRAMWFLTPHHMSGKWCFSQSSNNDIYATTQAFTKC